MASNQTNGSVSTSLSDLIERNCVNGINVLLSILGIYGNVIVVILVAKHSYLRKHCKYLQAALAVGDAVLCLGQLTNSITNLVVANMAPRIIRWQCLILSTHGATAIMYSMVMTVCIAFDRLIAIVFPTRYRTLPKKRMCIYSVCIAVTISVSFAVAAYTDVDLFDYPPGCIGSSSRSPKMSGLITNFNAAAGIVILVVYPITLVSISMKTKHFMKHTFPYNNENTRYFFKQVEITSSITCVIITSLVIYVIPNLLVIILKAYNAQPLITSKAPAYTALGSTIHSGINCLFYIWKDAKMRQAFCNLFFPGSSNQVPKAPTSSGQNRQQ